MPRPRPSFQEFKETYLKNLCFDPVNEAEFILNTIITFHCIKGHSYKHTALTIKNGVNPEECPHCKLAFRYAQQGVPKNVLETWAEKNNLILVTQQNSFSRWKDSATFECKLCKEQKTYNSIRHFETNVQFNLYRCEGCRRPKIPTIDMQQKVIDANLFKPDNLLPVEFISDTIPQTFIEKAALKEWHIVRYDNARTLGKFQCKVCGVVKECEPPTTFGRYGNEGRGCLACIHREMKQGVNIKLLKICNECDVLIDGDMYQDIKTPLKFICKKCGFHFSLAWNTITGNRGKVTCSNCSQKYRVAQNSVSDFIKTFYTKEVQTDTFKVISPLQLDIYLPEEKFAIEYCGLIWHSSKFKHDNNSHKNKLEMCEKQGIRLLTVFEDEWIHKRPIVESRIKNALGCTSTKINGRDCETREISTSEALNFCEDYHIQGRGHCCIAYGLFYNSELISVISFSKPSIAKGATSEMYDYELNRFCSKPDITIIGGASKLFSAFIKFNQFEKVLTFCDLRWGTGSVYEHMGFKYIGRTKPNYYYFGEPTQGKRVHRYVFTKQRLLERFGGSPEDTEHILAEKAGLSCIYDCGHAKYEYTRL
jgi:hypothetical protein